MTGTRVRAPQINAKRLQAMFGLGDLPRITLQLYERLERQAQTEDSEYAKIVSGVIRAAKRAENPRNYFAAVVTRRLRERGYE